MSELTSPHVQRTATAVADGAHVLVRGHIGDTAVWRGHVIVEPAAMAAELEQIAGTRVVVVGDAADGLRALDPAHRAEVERLLAGSTRRGDDNGAPGRSGGPSPIDVARGVRALLAQNQCPLVVILRDCDLLLNTNSDSGRRAVAIIRRAMEEAACVAQSGPVAHRNALVLLAGSELPCLGHVHDLVAVQADVPAEDALRAMIAEIADGFHGAGSPASEGTRRMLARALEGLPAHAVERVRRASHPLGIGLDEPVRLARHAARRAKQGRTFDEFDVDVILTRVGREVGGQPHALVALRVALHRAGRGNEHRPALEASRAPALVLLFCGPPGVGKTETARAIQRAISGNPNDMLRFNCAAELSQPHSVARLVGAPPGYVGHEAGGLLTEALAANPARVILFDEFDKADDEIAKALLSIIEDGSLRDGRGRETDFSQSIFIITSNFGSDRLLDVMRDPAGPPAFEAFNALARTLAEEAIRGIPEAGEPLWSRIARSVVPYDMLRREAIGEIVAPVARNVEEHLSAIFRITLTIDDASVAAAVAETLPADGRWDGRDISSRDGGAIATVLTDPLVAQLETVPRGSLVHARIDPGAGLQLTVTALDADLSPAS